MKSLENPQCKAEILARIGSLRPDSPRCWGKMTAPQMVCHLNDSFRGVMGLISGASDVGFVVGDATSQIVLPNASTGHVFSITPGDWRVFIRAWAY